MAVRNPMLVPVVAPNPLVEVMATQERRKKAERPKRGGSVFQIASGALEDMLRERLSPGGRRIPRGSGIGGGGMMLMSRGMPETEEQVRENDMRSKMRSDLLARIKEDRGARPDEYAMAEREYAEKASKRGAFLKKAYDVVGTPEGYTDFDVDLMRTQGLVNPLLDEYNPVTRERVAREFQRTHKWARKKENLADLDIAVKYLMSRPNFEQSFYYNP